ncbi:LysR substrate-binding domain-containing protein [Paenirhodobacter enshiensis]|uniref:LysR substrate-binding domain-containing protein n=1 Tax=Paenirhodobacter enshiensis TaxID=1105367 RepID=UPI003FA2F3C1
MDTRFLESLIAVAEQGSIVAAARAQGLTPAAVSQRIQVLERDLGAALLTRRANAALPTRACRDLLPAMRQLVAQARALELEARPDTAAGIFRLGAISTVLTAFVPDLLHRLHAAAPALELRIEPGSSAALYEALTQGELDAALIVEPPFALPPDLVSLTLRREPLRLLAPEGLAGHDVAGVFAALPLIAYDPRSWGGQIAGRYLSDHAIAPETLCELDALEAISKLVARGIGAALVPEWAELGTSRALPDGDLYARKIVAVAPRLPARPACLRAFRTALRAVWPDIGDGLPPPIPALSRAGPPAR